MAKGGKTQTVRKVPQMSGCLADYVDAPPSFRPPSWRWLVALDYLADPRRNTADLAFDPHLKAAADYCRTRKAGKRPEGPEKLAAAALTLFTAVRPHGWRWVTEALLMTGADYQDVASHVPSLRPELLEMYEKLFFDVRDLLSSPVEVRATILCAAQNQSDVYSVYDCTWKLFAYRWGLGPALTLIQGPMDALPKECTDWMKEQIRQNTLVTSFHVTQDPRWALEEASQEILKTADIYWEFAPAGKLKGGEGPQLKAMLSIGRLGEITQGLTLEMMTAVPKGLLPAREEFLNVPEDAVQTVPQT